MSTMPITAPVTLQTEARRPGLVLRILRAVVDAAAQANRQRAEREVAKVAHRYGLDIHRV